MEKRKVVLILLILLILFPLITAHELCNERISNNELQITKITDPKQNNETTWEWVQSSATNIKVEIKNKNLTQRNFQVELVLLDKNLIEINFTSTNTNPKQTISLDKNKASILNLSFTLKKLNEDKYYLYAKLTDKNNETICTSLRATSTNEESTIQMKKEEKIIIVRKVEGPTEITPGLEAKYSVEIINLGATTEKQVLAILYNAHLKIREEKNITDLGVDKSKIVVFNITIPKNASLTQEIFLFSTEYDYNKKSGFYYQSSDKSKIFYTQIIKNQDTQNQSAQSAQTINQTMQMTNQTNQTTSAIQSKSKVTKIPYLWPIIITLIIAIIIAILTFLFLKYNKDKYLDNTSPSPTPASTYVKEIQGKIKSSPIPQNKPSETNTANTKTPPIS